jgi:hypothetical protein
MIEKIEVKGMISKPHLNSSVKWDLLVIGYDCVEAQSAIL